MNPRFSVVIPAFNEERYLPRLLDSLDAAIAAYPQGRAAVEVIVADNASTDATAAIAASRGCIVAAVEKRCIAAARNGGARIARGGVLCFIDADSVVHPGTFAAVDATLALPKVVAGATGIVAERSNFAIAVSMALANALLRLLNFDAGVVFCRRLDFERVGGYDETMLFAEDLRLLMDLKRLGRFRRATGAPTVMSLRKCDKYGDWHFFNHFPKMGWFMLTSRRRSESLARDYWYDGRR